MGTPWACAQGPLRGDSGASLWGVLRVVFAATDAHYQERTSKCQMRHPQTHVCLHVETKGETLFAKSLQKSGEVSWDAWVSYTSGGGDAEQKAT